MSEVLSKSVNRVSESQRTRFWTRKKKKNEETFKKISALGFASLLVRLRRPSPSRRIFVASISLRSFYKKNLTKN